MHAGDIHLAPQKRQQRDFCFHLVELRKKRLTRIFRIRDAHGRDFQMRRGSPTW
jgi:hypothetical protein